MVSASFKRIRPVALTVCGLCGAGTALLAGWLASGCASVKPTSLYARALAEQTEECSNLASAGDSELLAACRRRLALLRELATFEESELKEMTPPLVPPRDQDIDTVDLMVDSLAKHR
jgi:hypothetical protein